MTPLPSAIGHLPSPPFPVSAAPCPKSRQGRQTILSQHLETLADMPGAMPKLRDLVLQFAIRGSLVPQDPKDEPAIELASRALSAAKQIAEEHNLKLPTPEFPVADRDKAFPLPKGWTWAKLGNLCVKLGAGSTPLGGKRVYQRSGVKFLRSQNVWDDGLHLDDVAFISPTVHQDMESTCVQPGDVLLNITGASIGRSALVPDDFDEANVSQHVSIVRLADKALRHFIHLCIVAPDFQSRIMQVQVGVSREGLSMARLKEFVIALPPLAEQRRIVTKVEELLALCRELEARQLTARERRTRLVHSALDHLTAAKDEQDFRKQASFTLHNSSLILDSVPSLRQAILALAVEGRLVLQNPADEPANKLLVAIAAEKQRFLSDRHSGKAKPPQGDATADISHYACPPGGWIWTTLGQVSLRIHYGYTASADHASRDVRLLRITDIQNNQVDWNSVPGCAINEAEVAKYRLTAGDILIARTGGTIGKTFLVETEPPKAVFASYLIRVIPSELVSVRFLKSFLESPLYWKQLRAKSAGTGQPNVNGEALSGLAMALPPLAEQQRIVAKVDELMRWCDELEAQLTAAQTTAAHLLDATLDRAHQGEL